MGGCCCRLNSLTAFLGIGLSCTCPNLTCEFLLDADMLSMPPPIPAAVSRCECEVDLAGGIGTKSREEEELTLKKLADSCRGSTGLFRPL